MAIKKKHGKTKMEPPKVGDLIVVLDPLGLKRFPVCIGKVQAKGSRYWEDR